MLPARALAVVGLVVALAPAPRSLSAHAAPPARTVVFARAHRPEPTIAPLDAAAPPPRERGARATRAKTCSRR